MFFFLYNLAVVLLAPIAIPYWLLRSRAKGQPWKTLAERLGYLGGLSDQTAAEAIWLHAVSVGEVLSIIPVIRGLRERLPHASIFVSTSTAAGRKLADEKLGRLVDGVFSAPLEFPWCVGRVFRTLRPRLLVVAETEIWPNYFLQAKRFGAEVLLINGRMSDRSAPRYRRLRRLFGPVLRRADLILTQSEADRDRFLAAGAPAEKTRVGGNLKYDFAAPAGGIASDLDSFMRAVNADKIVLAGSTREGEEKLLSGAFLEVAKRHPRTLFVVAPRHPQRFDEAAGAFENMPVVRRSRMRDEPSLPAVLLVDSLGELSSLYARADVVFMGGSLNGWGGHNMLEPALLGKAVVVGPTMQNFREITADLLAAGGLLQVSSGDELGAAFNRLLDNPEERRRLGENALGLAESRRGATARCVDEAEILFERALPRRPPSLTQWLLLGAPTALWALANGARRQAYAIGLLKPRRLRTPVVCVGNITAGGVGKTPMVAWLVERLAAAGRGPAVVTRGYGRDNSTAFQLVQAGDEVDPREIGDEPALLAARFRRSAPQTVIGIGADRFAVGTQLEVLAEDVDVFILDDGFQHFGLARDLDIVLIDTTQPLLDAHQLPLGRLREPLSSLKRAAVIVLTRAVPGRKYSRLHAEIRRWNAAAPIFHSWTTASRLIDANDRDVHPVEHLVGKKLLAFCGLGNPGGFYHQLRRLGYEVAERMSFPDHHRYSRGDLARVSSTAAAAGAEALVTTSKDLMNLQAAPALDQPLYALEIELEVDSSDELITLVTNAQSRRNQ